MSNSAHLFQSATLKLQRAERCHSVADALDRRGAVLSERHQPVVALHQEQVWRGRAATFSRVKLRRLIASSLYSLGLDLASTGAALRSEADRLTGEAADLRRRAHAAAAAEARARAEAQARAEAARTAADGSLYAPGVKSKLVNIP